MMMTSDDDVVDDDDDDNDDVVVPDGAVGQALPCNARIVAHECHGRPFVAHCTSSFQGSVFRCICRILGIPLLSHPQ